MAEEEQVEEVVREPVPPLEQEQIEERQKLWEEIFAEFPANKVKLASIEERKANEKMEDQSLTYGELDFTTVNNLITMLKNQHTRLYAGQGVFLDLGSGCGKACVAAALAHQFEKVIGIETMACLDEAAKKAQEAYKAVALSGDPPPEKAEVEFIKGDFVADLAATLEPLAPQIAVCIAVATCFGDEQLNALATLADKMADNSIIVTYSQVLPDWVMGGDKKLPQERFRNHLKEALSKRGTDPKSVQIDPSPPDAKPGGWRQIHEEDVSLPVGGAPMELPTKLFVFKRIPLPVEEQPQEAEGEQPVEES
jgi:tRNA G46 methylase TrmB